MGVGGMETMTSRAIPIRGILLALLLLLAVPAAVGQHDHSSHQPEPAPAAQQPSSAERSSRPMRDEDPHAAHGEQQHPGANLELGFGSGTAWLPQSSPSYMWMKSYGDWNVMTHANLVIGFNKQGGLRGAGKLQSQNWLMLMQDRKLGAGTLQLRQMFTAEPLTTPRPGFPQLFQTGETYRGKALVDHQHPHDLIGELSARYVVPVSENLQWSIYGGLAGEPAVGPVTFMHRGSALEIPDAPLSHHLQDSTHITFGVITTGLTYKRVKVEGSVFNGREPDEERTNFDFGALDSWAGRVSFAPGRNWTASYAYGFLRKPEALEDNNIVRQTAMLSYNRPLAAGNWATSLVWGRNRKTGHADSVQNSYLVETTLNFAQKNYAYTRLELVDKDELFPEGDGPGGHHASFRIGGYTFGGVRDIVQSSAGQVGIGAEVTFYSKPDVLDSYYGKRPVSFQIFVRLRPPKMTH